MLNRTHFFIREHVGMFKLVDAYDILDPQTQTRIGAAREEISALVTILRFVVRKSLLPTVVNIYEGTDESSQRLLVSIRRGVTLFRPTVQVLDGAGNPLGHFRSRLLSPGGAFDVFAPDGAQVARIKGDWKGWNFRFLDGERELGVVTKKWAGFGKELFTSADNYMISIHGAADPRLVALFLAAGLAIDTVFKEKE